MGSNILSGSILNTEIFSSTAQLYFESLQTTRFKGKLNIVKPTLQLKEYKQFWKKKREDTVTSPFGLHVGHFKAALQKEEILNVHRIMLLIPFQTALVPHRWKKTVQTMLQKDPGQPWIHRLRIIELFDSQVNAGFQIFIGRRMIWEAVNKQRLHPASFGSTPGKMAASAVLQKVLSVDQLRIERRAGGLFDCDATGCYDRIIPPLASIHLQALGLDQSIATLLAQLMFMAKRSVKTKHGVSNKSIQTTKQSWLYGIGQGNGGGPAIWLAHLTVMFTALSSICNGLIVCCVKGMEYLTTVGTGYVDDVTLVVSLEREGPQTECKVKNKVQQMAAKWEKLLFLTGGKLELSKCFWLPITRKWRHGEPVMNGMQGYRKDLKLKESESGDIIRIPRIVLSTAEKRLGIRYSVDGTWLQEYKYWIEFSSNFAQKIRQSRLDRVGGYQSYKSIWCAKFRYSAPAISLSTSQLKKIQQRIIGASLAVSGFSSKMPRAVVHGPRLYGGMQWETPYTILIYEQIKLFMGSLRLEDTVGKLLQLQLQWIQIAIGLSVPLLENKHNIPYLQKCWVQSLHEKLVETNIQLKIDKQWVPKWRRINDQIIMDYVWKNMPRTYWQGINQCRVYLNAITFSDIATFDGTQIPDSIFQIKEPYRSSWLLFPNQKRPPHKSRKQWFFLYSIYRITEGNCIPNWENG